MELLTLLVPLGFAQTAKPNSNQAARMSVEESCPIYGFPRPGDDGPARGGSAVA